MPACAENTSPTCAMLCVLGTKSCRDFEEDFANMIAVIFFIESADSIVYVLLRVWHKTVALNPAVYCLATSQTVGLGYGESFYSNTSN